MLRAIALLAVAGTFFFIQDVQRADAQVVTTYYAPATAVGVVPVRRGVLGLRRGYVPVVGTVAVPVTTHYAPPVTTYYPPAPVTTTYYAPAPVPVTTYYPPARVTTYYAPPVPAYYVAPPVRTYYAPPVIIGR